MRKTPVPTHKCLTPNKKTRSDINIITSDLDETRCYQVKLAPWTEFLGKVTEVEYLDNVVRIVLNSSQRLIIQIPLQQIASESTLPILDQFISVLRTDTAYRVVIHPPNPVANA